MAKMIFLCRRKPELDVAEYGRRILENHVPLALRHHPAMRSYRVNLVAREISPALRPTDSIAELGFDSVRDFRENLYDSEEGRRIIEADTATFLGDADAYATTEYLQIPPAQPDVPGGPTGRVKMIALLQRPEGQDRDEFRRLWVEEHMRLVREHHPGLVKYVANVVEETLSPGALPVDGISELHFASEESFRDDFYASEESPAIIAADTRRFIGRSCAFLVREFCFR